MPRTTIEAARDELTAAASVVRGAAVEFGRLTELELRGAIEDALPTTPELLELWTVATPVRFVVPFSPEPLRLFPPTELVAGQAGYGGETWDTAWVVIGEVAGDPVIADTSRRGTPIMLAMHGAGSWSPVTVAPDPPSFLQSLALWLGMLHERGDRLDEDRDFAVKPGWDDALRVRLQRALPEACADALVEYVAT